MLNEKGFDRWAEDYDADVARSDGEGSYPFAGYQRVLDAIARRVLERGTPRVLDLGFGTGTLTERLYRAGCQVFGQDFSPEMISAARGKMPEAQLFLGDLSHGLVPELAGRDYDCIVATYSLHHLADGEKVRFLRGYVQSIGFEKTTIEYEARPRFAGESKYSLKSLFKFSINTILCFSDLPLKLGIYSGVITALFGLIMVIYTVYTWKLYGAPNGYATIVVLISFMFSVLFVIVGIIGEYIAILFAEIKDRPVYIVKDTANFRKKQSKDTDGQDVR